MKAKLNFDIFYCIVIVVTVFASVQVRSQAMIDIRDPLRGVTFHSMEISNDSINDLQPKGNLFPADDIIKIGISALFFDDSTQVNEYILWFHHDGERKWFFTSGESPLTIQHGYQDSALQVLHLSSEVDGKQTGLFSEKLEFAVSAKQFLSILESKSVRFQLTTALGTIVKDLTEDEVMVLKRFDTRIKSAHSKTVSMLK